MRSMLWSAMVVAAVSFGCATTMAPATTPPVSARTLPAHLRTFVGTWDTTSEFQTEPGGPMQQSKGTAVGRNMGQPWVVLEHTGNHFGTPFSAVLAIGHDVQKGEYSGVWFDSLSSNVARYQGTVDATGQVLTLVTHVPVEQGATQEIREVIEVKSDDHIVLTTRAQAGAEWITVVTAHYRRRK